MDKSASLKHRKSMMKCDVGNWWMNCTSASESKSNDAHCGKLNRFRNIAR